MQLFNSEVLTINNDTKKIQKRKDGMGGSPVQEVRTNVNLVNPLFRLRRRTECVFCAPCLSLLTQPAKGAIGKDGQYRDTGSVEPGSRQFFGSLSGSESQFLPY